MKNIKYILPIFALGLVFAQDDDDMDAMWDNTVWNEIEDIADEEIQEIDGALVGGASLKTDDFSQIVAAGL